MKQAIDNRELIALDGPNGFVRGTYHKTRNDVSGSTSNAIVRDRVGVLFLHGLSANRAADGDAAVYWADSFAERGYPTFRFDLPGFGDSDGDPPTEFLDFVNLGGLAPTVSDKITELVRRFNLTGMVVAGHCAGAVSAVFAAAANQECRGLILMDPYFHLPPKIKQKKIRLKLNFWSLRSRYGAFLSRVLDLLKEVRLFLSGNKLPENANVSLLRRWRELASTGLPILVIKAPGRKTHGLKAKVGEFNYLEYALGLAGSKSQAVAKLAEGANHAFSNRLGRAAVMKLALDWLNTRFPLTECRDSGTNTYRSELGVRGVGMSITSRA
jgi:pimeloyl-ACP methyl ester carboxylesterase